MDEEKKKQLVSAWIWHHIDTARGRHTEEYFWAWEKLADFTHEQPELAWEVILAILAKNQTDVIKSQTEVVASNLAAGPLEDLLVLHGHEFIDRVEHEAKIKPEFRHLLGGVWQRNMPAEIWSRLQAVAGARW